MNDDGTLIRLDGVHKWFGTNHVLRGIDLGITPGGVVVIIGPSGSGKSTLLRTVNMLEEPTEGKVFFDGLELTDIRTNLNEARTHMGMVFQQFNLFPHLTALGNITLALIKVLRLPKEEAIGESPHGVGPCGSRGSGIGIPVAVVRRAAAACCHCPRTRHETESNVIRRSDVGPRSRIGG